MSEHKNPSVAIPVIIEDHEYIPHYASLEAAGADVKACIKEAIIIQPGQSVLIPTGIKAAIPEGFEIQVRPRSGLALKHQLTVLNTPGTIDADYRGEIKVILINHGREAFTVIPGMRIAQFILAPVWRAQFTICTDLTETMRGAGGFGHTG